MTVNHAAPMLSPLGQAALSYARRGWPVFPCRERDETLNLHGGKTRVLKAKAPYGGSGVKDATTDEDVIRGWWKRNPDAMIGLAMGHNGLFALDFDPRVDEESGEIFTLDTLKAALVEQMGCDLPRSLTAMTQSEGVHVYLLQPNDGGEPIRNRGNLPKHVDVRGLGGYVIAPPSILYREDGTEGRYSWLSNRHDDPIDAPEVLVEILRSKGRKEAKAPAPQIETGDQVQYRQACELVIEHRKASTSWIQRQLRIGYNSAARLVEQMEVDGIVGAPDHVGRRDVLVDTLPSKASHPHRSTAAASSAEEEAIRKYGDSALAGECRAVREAPSGQRNSQLNESALKIAALTVSTPIVALEPSWARSMLESAARANPGDDDDAQLLATIASGWSAGEHAPRDLTDVATRARQRAERPHHSSRSAPLPAPPPSDDDGKPSSQAGGEAAIAGKEGEGAAIDPVLTLECARYPMTDLGNLERFLARSGPDFLCVAAWAQSSTSPGYVAWDKTRWNRNMADALFGRAAQDTMRLIQQEADLIRDSGVPFPPEEGDLPAGDNDDEAEQDEPDDDDDADPARKAFEKVEAKRRARRSSTWYLQRHLARQTKHDGPRYDYIVQIKSNGDIVLYSDKLAAWGRTSESSGHIECIKKLAPARLSARPEDFDADELALNVQNGTLIFHRPDGDSPARVELREHRREDKITKIGRATYEPGALCPQFDAFLAQVQPAEDMREWLMRWSGYNALGIADAQVMALFYGEGSNGKGVWVQTHAHILGDYAWATGIETFMDSGFKRNGGGPSPHLAALQGRRMVYANEPEDNSKFSDGLVKSLTSDEPIGGVRELFGPAFELMITFTNTVMANNLPRIGTDFGIRRRMQVVPWMVIIAKEQQDKRLKDKLREEMSGILNKMIKGALAYLSEGLTMPEAMIEATKSYHEDNDILGQFLTMCVAREPGEFSVGATPLHELFKAWQTWAGLLPQNGQPWSMKKLRQEMERKSFKVNKSSSMKWHDIVLRFDPDDFLTADGKPVERDLPAPRHGGKPSAGAPIGASVASAANDTPPVPPSSLPPSSFDEDDLPP